MHILIAVILFARIGKSQVVRPYAQATPQAASLEAQKSDTSFLGSLRNENRLPGSSPGGTSAAQRAAAAAKARLDALQGTIAAARKAAQVEEDKAKKAKVGRFDLLPHQKAAIAKAWAKVKRLEADAAANAILFSNYERRSEAKAEIAKALAALADPRSTVTSGSQTSGDKTPRKPDAAAAPVFPSWDGLSAGATDDGHASSPPRSPLRHIEKTFACASGVCQEWAGAISRSHEGTPQAARARAVLDGDWPTPFILHQSAEFLSRDEHADNDWEEDVPMTSGRFLSAAQTTSSDCRFLFAALMGSSTAALAPLLSRYWGSPDHKAQLLAV